MMSKQIGMLSKHYRQLYNGHHTVFLAHLDAYCTLKRITEYGINALPFVPSFSQVTTKQLCLIFSTLSSTQGHMIPLPYVCGHSQHIIYKCNLQDQVVHNSAAKAVAPTAC